MPTPQLFKFVEESPDLLIVDVQSSISSLDDNEVHLSAILGAQILQGASAPVAVFEEGEPLVQAHRHRVLQAGAEVAQDQRLVAITPDGGNLQAIHCSVHGYDHAAAVRGLVG